MDNCGTNGHFGGLVMEMAMLLHKALRRVGAGELGWEWPTTVLTMSCELVLLAPISCWAKIICFWVRALNKYIQSLYCKSHYWLGLIKTKPGTFIYSTCNDNLISVELIRVDKKKCFIICTHIDFTQDDINNATNDDNEVKDVPGVSKVALHREVKHCGDSRTLNWVDKHLNTKQSVYSRFEGHELENHLHGEEHGEDQVQCVRQLGHMVRLVAVLFKVESKY